MTSNMKLQRFGLTITDVESNRAWWLAMPERLASRRRPRFAQGGLVTIRGHVHRSPRRWIDLSYDEQRAVLGLSEVTQ